MVLIHHKGKRISIPAKKVSLFSTGLIFRTKKTENIMFENLPEGNFALTSYFVFFPFLVLWLNNGKKVVDFRIARPFELSMKTNKKAHSLLEIPINKKNKKIIEFFVGKEKFKNKNPLVKA